MTPKKWIKADITKTRNCESRPGIPVLKLALPATPVGISLTPPVGDGVAARCGMHRWAARAPFPKMEARPHSVWTGLKERCRRKGVQRVAALRAYTLAVHLATKENPKDYATAKQRSLQSSVRDWRHARPRTGPTSSQQQCRPLKIIPQNAMHIPAGSDHDRRYARNAQRCILRDGRWQPDWVK